MTNRTKIAIAATGVAAGVLARNFYLRSLEREIAGEVVLITGGSRGLGLALARRFAREGCRIAICARDESELERAAADLSKRGAEVFTVRCDVTRRSDVEQMVEDVRQRFGRIDILVNNAGQIQVGPIEAMTVEDFEDAMNVMFWGVVYPTMTLLPSIMARNRGQIVNITSIGGKVGVPHLLPYSAAKYAAEGFSEGLHAELANTGVRITTIAPGLMRTGSYNAALFKGDQAAESRWFSMSASLPGLSMNANRAACQIVSAVKRGDAEKILSTPANLLAKAHALAPGLTQDLLGVIGSALLPKVAGDMKSKPGWSLRNLKSPKMRAILMLGRLAARHLNQRMA
ncbi:MAG TPA: SDR family NAD(P)-dependent oxidoreductase [Bryobacteraceae bacterium]|nr:SDR family NAD(P)-dependent oxidoreductase [Bryobacteraceae bacterium]